MMGKLFLVGAGGFLGAVARYGLGGLVHRIFHGTFPLGTLVVNVSGCLAIGVLTTVLEERGALGPNARLFLMIGILGGFTTFSSFGYETLALARHDSPALALGNVASNVLLGLAAVWLGWAVTRTLLG